MSYMTEREFADKIEWEGGILDAIDYGLDWGDCEPGELRDAWAALQAKYAEVQPRVKRVETLLEQLDDLDGEATS